MGLFLLLLPAMVRGQQLELSSASASTSATGPTPTSANANTGSQSATLQVNTGTTGAFSAYSPTTTVTVSFSNQQYTSSTYPGLNFGSASQAGSLTTLAAYNIFAHFDNFASPLNSYFTSAPDVANPGTNFDAAGLTTATDDAINYGFKMTTDAHYQTGNAFNVRSYYGDVTITFSRPVINPVLQISGLGGAYQGISASLTNFWLGFYTELELSNADVTAGRTLTRISGSTHFKLDATNTKILNDNAATSNSVAPYSSDQQFASGGSVIVNTGSTPITSITFRVYLRGDGGTAGTDSWSAVGLGRSIDGWLLSASLGLYNISGSVFYDANGLADNTVNGAGTNAGGLFANLVDANGNVYATTAVAANGTYTFSNVITSTYTVMLTTAAGTVGSPLSTSSLPAGWSGTGENLGSGAGSDGTADSKLAVVVSSANVANANFGIFRNFDFGDVPAAYENNSSAVSVPARNMTSATLRINTAPDEEAAAQNVASGADNNGTNGDGADEDGVTSPPPALTVNAAYARTISVANTTGAARTLYGWIDFNNNGIFELSEVQTASVANGATSATLTWTAAQSANVISSNLYMRLRIAGPTALADNAGTTVDERAIADGDNTGTYGTAQIGEVEDYQVAVNGVYDFGDVPSAYENNNSAVFAPARNMPSATLLLGTLPDAEAVPASVSSGSNNNATNGDGSDEDGIGTIPQAYTIGSAFSLPVAVTNTSGAARTLYGWIDFNNNGVFESGELASVSVANNTTAGTATLTWTAAQTGAATSSTAYMRLRIAGPAALADNAGTTVDERAIADGANTGVYGTVQIGEVEDYRISGYAVSGTVFNDANGLSDNTVNGTGTNLSGSLNAVLYDNTTGAVAAVAAVAANGTYSFSATPGDNFTVYITTVATTAGQTAIPAIVLSIGFGNTGENIGTGAGSDGTPDGALALGTVNAAISNADFGIQTGYYDFGDAPASYDQNNSAALVPARNAPSTTLMINSLPDAESAVQSVASGADNNGTNGDGADEDGLTSPPPALTVNASYARTISVTNTTGAARTLYGWIDFNNNGIFELSEVQTASVANNATSATLTWTAAQTINVNTANVYMRLRLAGPTALADNAGTTVDERAIADGANTGTYSTAQIGEVEDYQVSVAGGYDFGDAPLTFEANNAAVSLPARNIPSATLLLGTIPDAEVTAASVTSPANNNATNGDGSDEDGISGAPDAVTIGTAYSTTITVTNTSGSARILYGWIDFNNDGRFSSGEVATVSVATSTTNGAAILTWTAAQTTGVTAGNRYMRLRIANGSLTDNAATAAVDERSIADGVTGGVYGTPLNGEVEDYQVGVGNTDIAVHKTGPASASIGATVSYSITIANYGAGSATNVTVSDPAVSGLNITGVTCSTAGSGVGGTASCPVSPTVAALQNGTLTIPSLPYGSSILLTVTGTITGRLGNTVNNTVTVALPAGQTDGDPTNNSSTESTAILPSSCTGNTAVYTLDKDASVTANPTVALNGGTVNLVYNLTSGTALPGIGSSFNVPMQFSDLNAANGTNHQWASYASGALSTGPGTFVICPNAQDLTAGSGSIYNGLPANNTTTESLSGISNQNAIDEFMTTYLGNNSIDLNGTFTTTIGNYPAVPSGYAITSQTFQLQGRNNSNISNPNPSNVVNSAWYVKPIDQPAVFVPGLASQQTPVTVPYNATYKWKYAAFSNGSVAQLAQNASRGMMFYGAVTYKDVSSCIAGITGNVYDDLNGLSDNTVNGTGTNAGATLYAILYDVTTNTITDTVVIPSSGAFSLRAPSGGSDNFSVYLSTSPVTIGTTGAPSAALPSGWVNTGENLGASAGNDGSVNGILSIGTISGNTANANFGIDQTPTANNASGTFTNPGGTATVQVPTLTGSDPEQGTYPGAGSADTVIINTLPSSGTLYYNGIAVTLNQQINNYDPTKLTYDPPSGGGTQTFTYSEVDAALKSSAPATISMTFNTISVSGNVFDDANGLTDNTVNGTGTNGGGLNAVLIDNSTGKVVASTTVAAGGTYSFSSIDAGNYSIEITTAAATAGNTPPSVVLPSGYVSTGENLGAIAGNDGTVNGLLSLGAINANSTNVNFGIDQTPTANNVSGTFTNPGGTATVTVPTLNGADPEQGTFPGTGNADTVVINTLPAGGTLYYNGAAVTAGQQINNYNPALFTYDPPAGGGTFTFTYSEVDAALKSSTPATVSMTFNTISVSGNVYDDANGLTDNTVNGTGTNGGTLNAVLIDNITGKVVATAVVAAGGVYSFSNIDAGNYSIEITTGTATAGNTPPSVVLPSGYVSTGENLGASAGNDGTANGVLSLGAISANTTNANFGVDQIPTANNVSGTFTNPGGTATVQVPTLNGSDPEQGSYPGTGSLDTVIINTLPAGGTLYYNSVAVAAGQQINNYNPALLTYDPPAGGSTQTFTYIEVDAALKSSAPATVSMTFNTISVSGNVFDDANGMTDNTVNGAGTNGGSLNAVLIDNSTGKVIASTPVSAGGNYSFSGIDGGNYSVEITTNAATVGSTPPVIALPSGYVSTGENLGAAAGNDGTVNGILPLGAIAANTTNANFGIDRTPTANNVSQIYANPGGTATVQVPILNGSDPEQGIFPGTGNADTVIINTLPASGTLYYNGAAVTAGQQINNYNPALLTYDPPTGNGTFTFTYSEVDAALKSSAPATVSMMFNTISVSGNVYDDANGLTDNMVNGTGANGGGLNAVLIDVSTGNVVATTTVAANGTYSFAGINSGSYNVEITTNTATVGNAAPAVVLPAGWVTTGENLGASAGNDGTANSVLSLGAVSTDISNANFGIDQVPVANNVSQTYANPGGTAIVQVPTLNGSDPEQGTYPGTGNVDTVIINTLPASGTLYYNGVAVTAGQQINNYDPTKLTYDPPAGGGTYTFTYSEVDAALKSSTPAAVSMTFNTLSISGNVFDDANGLTDNTVNGTGINGGGLNAVLIDNATGKVAAITTVAANGTYSFAGIDGGNYSVEITINTATVGSTPPAVALSLGYVSTGENLGATAGNDGAVNGMLVLGTINANTINANFGIEQKPAANNVSGTFANPGGTSTVAVPTLNGTDPEDGTFNGTSGNNAIKVQTLPAGGTLYYAGLPVSAGDVISSYNPALLTYDPPAGSSVQSFTYSEIDAAGIASAPATAGMTFTDISISGSVYNDPNGTTNGLIDGTLTSTADATPLYANLVNHNTGLVVGSVPLAGGTYAFTGANGIQPNTVFDIVISTVQGVVGSTTGNTSTLPPGWANTADSSGAGDGTPNGIATVGVTNANISNIDFGIEKLPVVNSFSVVRQANPGGTTQIPVPQAAFTGNDAEDGVYSSGLSGKTVSLNPATNGTLYYNGVAVTGSLNITGFNPSLVSIDPAGTGITAVTPAFSYSVYDNAGRPSAPQTITMPFDAPISIGGVVWDDGNGNAVQDGTEPFISAGGLYASLTDVNGNVVQTVAVNSVTGAYNFDKGTSSASYRIILSVSAPVTGSLLTSSSLPTPANGNWVNTGVNLNGAANNANKTGIISITTTSSDVLNQNFGIEQQPTADAKSFNGLPNSAFSNTPPAGYPNINSGSVVYVTIATGSSSFAVYGPLGGSLSGSDPEDCAAAGTCNTTKTFKVTSVNANTQLYYDYGAGNGGVLPVTAGTTIANYDPAKLVIYGQNTGGTAAAPIGFKYSLVDAAGQASSIVNYAITTASPLSLKLLSFTAVKKERAAQLDWLTADEKNTAYFDVQHSADGITWTSLERIKSVGNTSSEQQYSFTDMHPVTGNNYYRLQMADNDGSSTLSNVNMLVFTDGVTVISMYPNPAKEEVHITGLTAGETILLYNLAGQLLIKQAVTKDAEILELRGYVPGVYEAVIMNGATVIFDGKIHKNE
ncbi:GEVED domain-containing protein [Chitinophagaceae bacterium MMS25-I14]